MLNIICCSVRYLAVSVRQQLAHKQGKKSDSAHFICIPQQKQGATATTGDAFVPLASRKIYGKLLQNETGLK